MSCNDKYIVWIDRWKIFILDLDDFLCVLSGIYMMEQTVEFIFVIDLYSIATDVGDSSF